MKHRTCAPTLASIVAAITLAAPAVSVAQDPGLYAGFQLAKYNFENPPVANAEEYDPGMYVGRLGYRFHPTFALEARYANSRTHDPVTAAFARVALPLSGMDLYGLVGASEVRPNDFPIEDENNLALGVGITLYGARNRTLGLEYVSYSDNALHGVGIGFVLQFDQIRFR